MLLVFSDGVYRHVHDGNVRSQRGPERLTAELNAAVYGISGDNPFAQEAWAQKEKITVPLLSDYEHKVGEGTT